MTAAPRRPKPPLTGDERTQLNGFLDFLRASVAWKASGLTDEQARQAHLPSELTTIAGLVRHLELNEWYWFSVVLGGHKDTWQDTLGEDPDAEFRVAFGTSIDKLIADYEAECGRSREIVAKLDFDQTVPFRDKGEVTVRWVVTHMIEETGRHAGHLDLLRELTDGLTGE